MNILSFSNRVNEGKYEKNVYHSVILTSEFLLTLSFAKKANYYGILKDYQLSELDNKVHLRFKL